MWPILQRKCSLHSEKGNDAPTLASYEGFGRGKILSYIHSARVFAPFVTMSSIQKSLVKHRFARVNV